ncbi:MAG: hypothetical protein AVDCRST_MAG71-709, partial [uncultured Lysobacter sp.]
GSHRDVAGVEPDVSADGTGRPGHGRHPLRGAAKPAFMAGNGARASRGSGPHPARLRGAGQRCPALGRHCGGAVCPGIGGRRRVEPGLPPQGRAVAEIADDRPRAAGGRRVRAAALGIVRL